MATISEIGKESGFVGAKFHKQAILQTPRPVTLDYSGYGTNINTSVDCYVTGIYFGKNGQSLSVKQRYTIYISYNKESQTRALQDLRQRIISDFEQNFPDFKVSDVFIPEGALIDAPGPKTGIDEMYYGSELFKRMSRRDMGRFYVGLEKDIMESRISQLKRKYKLR